MTKENAHRLWWQRSLHSRRGRESVAMVDSGDADVAFLIKPITLDQLRDVSLSGEVMPQKSTDFYPKAVS